MKRVIACLLIFCLGCARGPSVSQSMKISNSRLSGAEAREVETGRQIHQAILSSFHVYTEPRVAGYVSRVGRSLGRVSKRKNLEYRFTILYDSRAYATQAPGGFVYITTGFLNFVQNEAELAAVLAYEVANLQYPDPRFSKSKKAMHGLVQGGAIVAPFFGQIGMLAAAAIILLNAWSESAVPSQKERIEKIDRMAIHYLLLSKHDPQGYLDFLNRLLNMNSEWSPYFYDYLATRPVTADRYQKVLAEFEKMPLEGKSFDVHHARYLEITKGVREIYQG